VTLAQHPNGLVGGVVGSPNYQQYWIGRPWRQDAAAALLPLNATMNYDPYACTQAPTVLPGPGPQCTLKIDTSGHVWSVQRFRAYAKFMVRGLTETRLN
jgi:hypothetical protein